LDLEKFNENLGPRANTFGLYHVSEYLAAAAKVIAGEKKALGWCGGSKTGC